MKNRYTIIKTVVKDGKDVNIIHDSKIEQPKQDETWEKKIYDFSIDNNDFIENGFWLILFLSTGSLLLVAIFSLL